MSLTADISKDASGQFAVTAYKQFDCPACGRFMCELVESSVVKIQFGRCGARWKFDSGKSTMIRPPKKIAGKMLLDGVEKLFKK